MKHKYNASILFPTWYKSIEPIVSDSTKDLRIKAIEKILLNDDVQIWLDVVRLALKLKPISPTSSDTLVEQFREADINFPLSSNENILRVLSQILLCFLFESNHMARTRVAEAVRNTVFFGQFEVSEIPYYSYAGEVLLEVPAGEDFDVAAIMATLNDLEGQIEQNEDEDSVPVNDDEHSAIVKAIKYLNVQNSRLSEESNVLWWLFGSYSSLHEAFFEDVGIAKMILSAPKELSALCAEGRRLSSSKNILLKALLLSNEGKKVSEQYSILDVIQASDSKLKLEILEGLSLPDELTPCIFAVHSSVQFEDETLWKSLFSQKIPAESLDKKFSAMDLAYQLYNEILFLTPKRVSEA